MPAAEWLPHELSRHAADASEAATSSQACDRNRRNVRLLVKNSKTPPALPGKRKMPAAIGESGPRGDGVESEPATGEPESVFTVSVPEIGASEGFAYWRLKSAPGKT